MISSARAVPRVLSIAGSDSGGGAGIQADLKAFARCGVHGMTAVTAVTAQNTLGVDALHLVPAAVVAAQIRAVVEDIGVDAVKVGMLGDQATVEVVADALGELPSGTPVVLDPVLVSSSGAPLLEPSAVDALRDLLVARATVVTPNLPEARVLAGERAGAEGGQLDDAGLVRAVHALGARFVVLTGGHRERVSDLFFDGEQMTEIPGERHASGATHGSGCTHSAALAARLALGDEPLAAARAAQAMAAAAVRRGLAELGGGPGPVDVLGLAGGG